MSGETAGEGRGFTHRPQEKPRICSVGAGICLHRGDKVRKQQLSTVKKYQHGSFIEHNSVVLMKATFWKMDVISMATDLFNFTLTFSCLCFVTNPIL